MKRQYCKQPFYPIKKKFKKIVNICILYSVGKDVVAGKRHNLLSVRRLSDVPAANLVINYPKVYEKINYKYENCVKNKNRDH